MIDNNWTTAANWEDDVVPAAGDRLVFAGNTQIGSFNDFPELPQPTIFDGITFQNGDFTLSGNAVVLNPQDGVAIDNILGHNTIALSLTLAPAATGTAIVQAGSALELGADAEATVLADGADVQNSSVAGGATPSWAGCVRLHGQQRLVAGLDPVRPALKHDHGLDRRRHFPAAAMLPSGISTTACPSPLSRCWPVTRATTAR